MSLAGPVYDDAPVTSIPLWDAPASSAQRAGPYRES
jgi:hypothetical protein